MRSMKDKLDSKIITGFTGLRTKTDHKSENKKATGTKKCVIKKPLNLKIINTVQKQLNVRIQ